MTTKEALAQLKILGNDKLRAQMIKRGAPENPFGVKHGDSGRGEGRSVAG